MNKWIVARDTVSLGLQHLLDGRAVFGEMVRRVAEHPQQ